MGAGVASVALRAAAPGTYRAAACGRGRFRAELYAEVPVRLKDGTVVQGREQMHGEAFGGEQLMFFFDV